MTTPKVIAYDAHGGMFAARLWWLLRSIGHASGTLLDGGLATWQALSTVAPPVIVGNINVRPTLVAQVDIDNILNNLTNQQRTLVDARAPHRFRGEIETIDPIGGTYSRCQKSFFQRQFASRWSLQTWPSVT
ncbi:MAG: hypothetical protein H7240_03425 [Glaciimonas sp.]|nr:hypothetical protein [Glaciimonas sp.]